MADLGRFRRSKNDRASAAARETSDVGGALHRDQIDPRFRAAMVAAAAATAGTIQIGTSVHDPSLGVFLKLADLFGSGHGLVLGRTGAGKTRVVLGIAAAILRLIAADPEACGLTTLDFKGDLHELVRSFIAELVGRLPSREANRLIDALVIVDPFASSLMPFNVLARDPDSDVSAEVQAYEVCSLFDRMTRSPTGVNQDAWLYHLLLLAVCDPAIRFPDLGGLIADPRALAAVAARSAHPDVRRFFAQSRPLAGASAAGLQARLLSLFRLPSTRLMLGAKRGPRFRTLLGQKIVLANLGSPPMGCEDIARWWGGLLTLKFTRAIFERTTADVARPVLIAIDEWQEGLAAGSEMAENYERVLSMARSKGVALMLISQSLAGAAKVSASLPKIVATNTSQQLLFSASPDDARAMAHLLPVSGRMPRPRPLPWEDRPRSPFLSPQEEVAALVDGAAQLGQRTFYYWNRNAPYRAQLVRAVDVDVSPPAFLPAGVAHRINVGSEAVPIADLEREANAREQAATPTPSAVTTAASPAAVLGPSRWKPAGTP